MKAELAEAKAEIFSGQFDRHTDGGYIGAVVGLPGAARMSLSAGCPL
jgi:hypothetical protein